MINSRLLAAGLLGALTATGAAYAQGNPSADQIINSLRPGTGIMGGTRGIRPVSPTTSTEAPPPVTPSAAAAVSHPTQATHSAAPTHSAASTQDAAPAVQARPVVASAPSVNLTVQFANNSAELTPAASRTLAELGSALTSASLATYRFRIEGHTDTVGSPQANKALSERRAQAVVAFLSANFKIDASRLDAVGMGEDGLLKQTPPNTAEPRNRRVQVINLGS